MKCAASEGRHAQSILLPHRLLSTEPVSTEPGRRSAPAAGDNRCISSSMTRFRLDYHPQGPRTCGRARGDPCARVGPYV